VAKKDKGKGGGNDKPKPPKHQHNYKIKQTSRTPVKGGQTRVEITWHCTCGEWIAGEMWFE
jgi:hypothetical protein